MVDFKKLKASSKNSLAKITEELQKMADSGGSNNDDRFWYPAVDKAGNGFAIIRFLPAPGDEEVPFIRLWEHGFKGPTGKWYIEKSLSSIGKDDPVMEFNAKLWNSTEDDKSAERTQVREQKRKLHYISNIYVVKDGANPENNGKVFLFKYGKKIFEKLNDAMNPKTDMEEPLNPFDLWEGANFRLKIRKVEGYRNYDNSQFDPAGPLSNDDAELEAIWKQEHSLQAFLDPSQFKSYDELKKQLNAVLGLNQNGSVVPAVARQKAAKEDDDLPFDTSEDLPSLPANTDTASEDDEDLDYFKKLAQ